MAKNEFHACTQAKSFSLALLFPLPFFSISSFVAHSIFFLLHGIVAGQLFRKGTNIIFKTVVGKQWNWPWIFPQDVTFFVTVTLLGFVRISKMRHCLERSIFSDVFAYQFINLNCKLNESRKENMHRSIWNKNDQSSRRRVTTKSIVNLDCSALHSTNQEQNLHGVYRHVDPFEGSWQATNACCTLLLVFKICVWKSPLYWTCYLCCFDLFT